MNRTVRPALRLAAITFVAGVLLGLLVPRLLASEKAASPRAHEVHVVSGGETLWGVAQRFASGEDPRPYIDEIQRLNGLEEAVIFPGQTLILPPRVSASRNG